MIVTDRMSYGLAALIVTLFLMFSASTVFADEGEDILVLVGGIDGPDPEIYPVSETVFRWMQSIIEPDDNIELINVHGVGFKLVINK